MPQLHLLASPMPVSHGGDGVGEGDMYPGAPARVCTVAGWGGMSLRLIGAGWGICSPVEQPRGREPLSQGLPTPPMCYADPGWGVRARAGIHSPSPAPPPQQTGGGLVREHGWGTCSPVEPRRGLSPLHPLCRPQLGRARAGVGGGSIPPLTDRCAMTRG